MEVISSWNTTLDMIREWTENIIYGLGVSGSALHVLSLVVLILFTALMAWLSYYVCRAIIVPIVQNLTRHTANKWDDIVLGLPVLKAACQIVPAIVVWTFLPMVFYKSDIVRELIARATAIYITVMTIHLCFVFISQLKSLDTGRRSSAQQYILSFLGLLRITVAFIGGVVIIALAIGRNPLSLLAGLGAASAVIMLVFKDTIEGLVAGIRLTSADMLHVGDWITVSSVGANGTVTEMSLTTVKVRNFDNTIVTVSPKTLVSGSFQNWKGMQGSTGRRVNRKIYIDFRSIHFTNEDKTETNIGKYRKAVEKYLKDNPLVNPKMTLMVRQQEATQCGLPIEVYFFLKEKTWVPYEHQLAAVMEHIYCMAADYDLKIYEQYPEQ